MNATLSQQEREGRNHPAPFIICYCGACCKTVAYEEAVAAVEQPSILTRFEIASRYCVPRLCSTVPCCNRGSEKLNVLLENQGRTG